MARERTECYVLPGRVDTERVNTITELIATENGLHVVNRDAEFNMNCTK
jgi:hypothetical protein